MKISKSNVVLIICAHVDDETLGIGGTISRHVYEGNQVFAMSMTNGIGSRNNCSSELIQERLKSAQSAAQILGFEWILSGDFPDNAMDKVSILEVVKLIENVKKEIKPTLIYTHSSADLNIDHRIVNQATLTAFRPQENEIWEEIRTFEVPSSTDYGHKNITNHFNPNLYIDITGHYEKKYKALKKYDQEMKNSPNSRSYEGLETLAKYRGHQAGLKYAEAFEVLRKINR